MEHWLNFARGPLFIATFSLMILGLGRLVFLRIYLKLVLWFTETEHKTREPITLAGIIKLIKPERGIPPIRPLLGAVSLFFHVGLLVVPLFLVEHAILWKHALGFSWPSLGRELSDFLTIMTILTGVGLIAIRALTSDPKHSRSWSDYLLLGAMLVPFVSGYLTMHPQYLFTRVETMMLVHMLGAELVFVLIPFTSLSHIVLLLFDRAISDFYLRPAAIKPLNNHIEEGVSSDVRHTIR